MSATAGQPPQRVCPRCSTIARTVDAHCPFCGAAYRRRGPWLGVALTALLVTGAVLAGVALMLIDFGSRAERELDTQVQTVQRELDRDVRGLEDRIERELDERLPQGGTAIPGG